MIAALYIDPRGPYPKMDGVDAWDESRDARKYDGPHPIVAHPPCGPWGALRPLYRGNEHACAPLAVQHVRQFGGVLEHPARSLLWHHYDLPLPTASPSALDPWHGFSIAVDQCDWGHVARKPTWLYCVGVPQLWMHEQIRQRAGAGTVTHWISSSRRTCPSHIRICSAEQRRRTPPLFADLLVAAASRAWSND